MIVCADVMELQWRLEGLEKSQLPGEHAWVKRQRWGRAT